MAALTGKPASTLSRTIGNDGFWPDVDVRRWLEEHRIPAEYQDELIVGVLRAAMIECNRALGEAKAAAIAQGYDRLTADPEINDSDLITWAEAHPEVIDNEAVAAILYRNAVYNLAKAKALRRFATIDRRPNAENEAKSGEDTEAYFLDEYQANVGAIRVRMVEGDAGKTNFGVYVGLIGDGQKCGPTPKPAAPTQNYQPRNANLSALAGLDSADLDTLIDLAALEGNGVPRRTGGAWTMANWPTGDGGDYIEFTQAAPLATWSILHNLGRRPSAVMVVDSAGVQVLAETQHYSLNELRIYFGSPQTGAAYLS